MKRKKFLFTLLTGALTLPLLFCACGERKDTKKTVVIFDSDFGTDDAIALMIASDVSRDMFDYIIASQGNASLDGAVKNAVILKTDLGVNATIVQGMPPATDENVDEVEKNTFHGKDGLANIQSDLIASLGLTQEQLDDYMEFSAFTEEIEKADEIVYISVGPTTNLAQLIDNETIRSKISKAYIMGGGINEFNCSNDTEFNFSKDPQSVKKILDSGLDITLFPLDLINHQVVTHDMIAAYETYGIRPEFIEFLKFNLKANESYNGVSMAEMHDSMPVLYYVAPEEFQVSDMKITVDKCGSTKVSDDGALIHVATGVQDSLLKEHLVKAFSYVNVNS